MAATDQQLLDEARDSLLRILQTDSAELSESARRQRHLEIMQLHALIDRLEKKTTNAAGRRIFHPIKRVDV